MLLVGELVANSVVHANADEADEIVMELVIDPDFVRVAVTDRGSSWCRRSTQRRPCRGRGGLFLVEQLSDRWGITRDGTQLTQVWFEMAREDQKTHVGAPPKQPVARTSGTPSADSRRRADARSAPASARQLANEARYLHLADPYALAAGVGLGEVVLVAQAQKLLVALAEDINALSSSARI